jgi:hypothetical protein
MTAAARHVCDALAERVKGTAARDIKAVASRFAGSQRIA